MHTSVLCFWIDCPWSQTCLRLGSAVGPLCGGLQWRGIPEELRTREPVPRLGLEVWASGQGCDLVIISCQYGEQALVCLTEQKRTGLPHVPRWSLGEGGGDTPVPVSAGPQ